MFCFMTACLFKQFFFCQFTESKVKFKTDVKAFQIFQTLFVYDMIFYKIGNNFNLEIKKGCNGQHVRLYFV